MSIRELISKNIVEVLKDARDPKPTFVTRETLNVQDLSRAQYPAIFVSTDGEERSPLSLLGNSGSRIATITYNIACFVTGSNIDTLRNDIVERVEEALAVDVTRGGIAIDTQVIAINVNNDMIAF